MNFDQMRDLLLEQAFQGHLVPQLKEEPTIEPDSKVSGDVAFEIPQKWKWATLDDCVVFNPKIQSDDDADVSFIPMQACEAGYVSKLDVTDVRKWKTVKKGFSKFQDQDVLMAKITPCFQNRKSAIAENLKGGIGAGTTEFHVLRCNKNLLPKYLLFFLKSSYLIRYGVGHFKGTAGQQRIGKSELKNCAVPIPSLNEQRRIVAKLEESFAEIDRAEKAYRELQTLTSVLRGKILQEAVMGKLVPQLDDEPAVEQIGEVPEDVPFEIPEKWKWGVLSSIVPNVVDCPHSTPKYCDSETEYLAIDTNCIDDFGKITKWRYVTEEIYRARITRLTIQADDVIYTREGSIGRAARVPVDVKVCMGQRVMLIRPGEWIDSSFLQIYLMSKGTLSLLTEKQRGIGVKHINVSDVKKLPVPIPPLEEQRRIVAKVEELMVQVDRLAT